MTPDASGSRRKLGVALGCGGSRAFIHVGVLSRLEEAGLAPYCLSGSSMGAVLGALYAANPSAKTLFPRILDYFRKSPLMGGRARQDTSDGLQRRPGFFGSAARKLATASVASIVSMRKGLRRLHPVNRAIDDLFKAIPNYEDLRLPFASNAVNLTRGEVSEFASGPLAPALKAGVAIGLIFAPYRWNGDDYADAAPLAPVPAGLCRKLGAEVVFAVDICAPLVRPLEPASGFEVVQRLMSLQSEALNTVELAHADVVLRIDASDVFWADFSRIDELVERGRAATEGVLDELRGLVDSGA